MHVPSSQDGIIPSAAEKLLFHEHGENGCVVLGFILQETASNLSPNPMKTSCCRGDRKGDGD